jgi:hypothetical protein
MKEYKLEPKEWVKEYAQNIMEDKNIKILKRWKDNKDWFSVSLDDCLDKLEGNINLSNTEIIEALKEGATLQSFSALYKAE